MTSTQQPTPPDTIRIVIAEDYTVVKDALETMLSFESNVTVVATTTSGSDAVRLVHELGPDIVLMDVALDGLNGIEATRKISESRPSAAVIVLTMYDDADTVARAVAAGARGYVPKMASRDELIGAINAVAAGEGVLHPTVTGPFLRLMAPLAEQTVGGERLTDREQQVLQHLVEGMTSKQIAAALIVGEETVKTHLRSIYQRLGVSDRVQAVAFAIRHGLVP